MANVWAKLDLILTEITVTNPVTYSGMTNQQVATKLNENIAGGPARSTLSASELFESIDMAAYQGLTAVQRERVNVLLGLGDNIQVGPGSRARAWILDAFGNPSTTVTALLELIKQDTTRARQIGIDGLVEEAHVEGARGGNTAPLP